MQFAKLPLFIAVLISSSQAVPISSDGVISPFVTETGKPININYKISSEVKGDQAGLKAGVDCEHDPKTEVKGETADPAAGTGYGQPAPAEVKGETADPKYIKDPKKPEDKISEVKGAESDADCEDDPKAEVKGETADPKYIKDPKKPEDKISEVKGAESDADCEDDPKAEVKGETADPAAGTGYGQPVPAEVKGETADPKYIKDPKKPEDKISEVKGAESDVDCEDDPKAEVKGETADPKYIKDPKKPEDKISEVKGAESDAHYEDDPKAEVKGAESDAYCEDDPKAEVKGAESDADCEDDPNAEVKGETADPTVSTGYGQTASAEVKGKEATPNATDECKEEIANGESDVKGQMIIPAPIAGSAPISANQSTIAAPLTTQNVTDLLKKLLPSSGINSVNTEDLSPVTTASDQTNAGIEMLPSLVLTAITIVFAVLAL